MVDYGKLQYDSKRTFVACFHSIKMQGGWLISGAATQSQIINSRTLPYLAVIYHVVPMICRVNIEFC